MFSVVDSPRFCFHAVVSHSRPCALALASISALGSWPLEALAAPSGAAPPGAAAGAAIATPELRPSPFAAEMSSAAPPEKSYRDLLTTSYVVAPLFALAVGAAMAELDASDSAAVFGAGLGFFAPALVHMAHGKVVHGPLAFLGMAASTTVGTLLGGVVGYGIDASGCDPEQDSDGCDFAGLGGLILGALVGGVGGYTGFAIYDVSSNGAVPLAEPRPDRASLQLWLSPLPAARGARVEGAAPFGGVQIGALLQL